MTRRQLLLILIAVPVLMSGVLFGIVHTHGMSAETETTINRVYFWFSVVAGVAILAFGLKPPQRYHHARPTVWQTLALASGPLLPAIAQVLGRPQTETGRLMVELVAKTLFLVGILSYFVSQRRRIAQSR